MLHILQNHSYVFLKFITLCYQIVFPNKDADHLQFKQVLEESFPKLKDADGKFLLYRGKGNSGAVRELEKIPPSPNGYTIPWLRDRQLIGAV